MNEQVVAMMDVGCRWVGKSMLMSALAASLFACSSGLEKAKPAELMANPLVLRFTIPIFSSSGASLMPDQRFVTNPPPFVPMRMKLKGTPLGQFMDTISALVVGL